MVSTIWQLDRRFHHGGGGSNITGEEEEYVELSNIYVEIKVPNRYVEAPLTGEKKYISKATENYEEERDHLVFP